MLTNIDLEKIQKIVKTTVKEEIKPIREDIIKIRKDQKIIIEFFDNEYLELRERIEKIENHLNLTSAN